MLLWLQDLKLRPQAWGSPPSPSVPPGGPGEGLQGPPPRTPRGCAHLHSWLWGVGLGLGEEWRMRDGARAKGSLDRSFHSEPHLMPCRRVVRVLAAALGGWHPAGGWRSAGAWHRVRPQGA